MKNNSTKTVWIVIGIIIIAIVAIVALRGPKTHKPTTDDVPMAIQSEDTTVGSLNQPVEQTAQAPKPMSYDTAVAMYGDRRIQFDKECQAFPKQITFKNGSSVMLDNHSPFERVIGIGQTVTIKPYSFKIVILKGIKTPDTILVDCGSVQNVATVLLQK